jgi:8-oxo-dGTP pyrophosphatase MutT (NUDIX family)
MNLKKWTHGKRTVLLEHPRITLVEDIVDLPDGSTMPYIRMAPTKKHSVAVIALNNDGEMLVQREYSYPPDEIMWQLPGGGAELDEDVIEAAKRELSEESGLTAKTATVIGYFYTANRLTDQRQYVVVCTDLIEKKSEADQGEFIETHWLSMADINEKVAKGEITNINFLACLRLWESTVRNG